MIQVEPFQAGTGPVAQTSGSDEAPLSDMEFSQLMEEDEGEAGLSALQDEGTSNSKEESSILQSFAGHMPSPDRPSRTDLTAVQTVNLAGSNEAHDTNVQPEDPRNLTLGAEGAIGAAEGSQPAGELVEPPLRTPPTHGQVSRVTQSGASPPPAMVPGQRAGEPQAPSVPGETEQQDPTTDAPHPENVVATKASAERSMGLGPVVPSAEQGSKPSRSEQARALAEERTNGSPRAKPSASLPVSPNLGAGAPLPASTGRPMDSNVIPLDAMLGLDGAEAETALPPSLHSSTAPVAISTAIVHRLHPPPVAQQLVAAVLQSDAQTTEIRLNPEELGRVRITLNTGEQGLSVVILAERQETSDMMRRNLDALAQEFQQLGYDDISFTFSQGGEEEGQSQGDTSAATTAPPDDPAQPDIRQPPIHLISGGLDLKL